MAELFSENSEQPLVLRLETKSYIRMMRIVIPAMLRVIAPKKTKGIRSVQFVSGTNESNDRTHRSIAEYAAIAIG
jgi:hypothetical protein